MNDPRTPGASTGARVELRVAGTPDVDRLLAMMAVFNAGEGIVLEPAALRTALERLLERPDLGRVWLIETEGEAVGYAVVTFGYDLEFAGQDAFITELYLAPDARGRGLGRSALAAIEAATAALGAHAMHLM